MEAKVSGDHVVIKIGTDELKEIFNGHPSLWHEDMRVKFKNKFAQSFATVLDAGLNTDPEQYLEDMFNAVFEEMMENDDPSIVIPKEDE